MGLNPLTRIHCLPTPRRRAERDGVAHSVSQSPDEDSLSSDATERSNTTAKRNNGLNPLTRIHCLPTLCRPAYAKSDPERPGLNPLTRIHCLPTPPPPFKFVRLALILSSQSPDEDSLSSDDLSHYSSSSFLKTVSIP